MEDEQGYMALSLQPQGRSPAPAGNQGSRPSLRCYKHTTAVLGGTCAALTLAVILLSCWGFQDSSQEGPMTGSVSPRSGNEGRHSLEDFRSDLRQRLCDPMESSSTGGAGCKLCPVGWQLHKNKCYWVSKETKPWSESRDDCPVRRSRLLVIRDKEELELVQDITRSANRFWIGLSISSPDKTWTWLNGSKLDQTLFSLPGSDNGNSCGAIKEAQIHADICSAVFQWICQKDAPLI